MYIILLIILLVLFIIPDQLDQWSTRRQLAKANDYPVEDSFSTDDIIASRVLGLPTVFACGSGAHGCTTPMWKLDYPIGSQADKGLDALILCRFYVYHQDDCWLVTEAERAGDDWIATCYHRSSGAFEPQHGWQWEQVSVNKLDELRETLSEKHKLALTFDGHVRSCKKTVKDFVTSKKQNSRVWW